MSELSDTPQHVIHALRPLCFEWANWESGQTRGILSDPPSHFHAHSHYRDPGGSLGLRVRRREKVD